MKKKTPKNLNPNRIAPKKNFRAPRPQSAFLLLFIFAVIAALVSSFFFFNSTKEKINDKAALNEVVSLYKSGAYQDISIE